MSDAEKPHQEIQSPSDSDPILLRGIYMVVFYVVFAFSRFLLLGIAILQFANVLFTEAPQEDLQRFSRGLHRYLGNIVDYLSFNTNEKPFPFSPWPSDANIAEGE